MIDKLRSGLIHLAASNPELRADLLPLLKSAKGPWWDPAKYPQFTDPRQQEIAAVKDVVGLFVEGAPHGKVLELNELAKDMGPAKASVKKYLPSLMSVGGARFGDTSLVWPKDERGNYDKSRVMVVRKGRLSAEKTAGLSKAQILSLAKDALGNEKLAKIVVSVLTKPAAWKFTKNWDEQTWKGALANNAKNYEGLASDE